MVPRFGDGSPSDLAMTADDWDAFSAPPSPAQIALSEAEALVISRRWTDAIPRLGLAAAGLPGDARPYALLVQCHLQLSDTDSALEAALRGVAQDPYSEWMHRAYSAVLSCVGRHHDAEHEARIALQIAPTEPLCLARLCATQLELNQLPQAVALSDELLQRVPGSALAHEWATRVAIKAGSVDDAQRHLQTWQELAPSSVEAERMKAVILQRSHRGKMARATLSRLVSQDPGATAPRNLLQMLVIRRCSAPFLWLYLLVWVFGDGFSTTAAIRIPLALGSLVLTAVYWFGLWHWAPTTERIVLRDWLRGFTQHRPWRAGVVLVCLAATVVVFLLEAFAPSHASQAADYLLVALLVIMLWWMVVSRLRVHRRTRPRTP